MARKVLMECFVEEISVMDNSMLHGGGQFKGNLLGQTSVLHRLRVIRLLRWLRDISVLHRYHDISVL